MEKVVENLRVQLGEILKSEEDLFLVDFIFKGSGRGGKLTILLDGDNGISIDQCASISRRLSRFMDENIELESPLTLEVSSAGLDHPIAMLRQYQKNVGKNIKTSLNDSTEVEGKLLRATDDQITIEVLKDKKKKLTEERNINFEDINKTIVLISFK